MKRRILALLLAGALLTGLSSAAEPGQPEENREEALDTAVLPDASGEAPEETAEQPKAPAEQDPSPETEEETSPETEEETTPEAEEETAGTQAAAAVRSVHASTGEELMEYLTDGASDLEITLDGKKDYVIYTSVENTSTGTSTQSGFYVKNLRNVTIRGQEGTRILTPYDCGGYAVVTLINCTDVTLDTLSIGHLDQWCGAPVLVLRESTGVELQKCDLWGCGYYGIGCNNGSSFHAQDTVIRDCQGYIMRFTGGTAVFDNCTFRDNCELKSSDNSPFEAVALQGTPNSAVFNNCQFLRNKNTFKLEAAAESRYTFNGCTETDNGWNNSESITLSVGTSASLTLVGGAATITGSGAVDRMSYENFSKISSQVTTLTVGSGITELGDDSLGGLKGLREVSLPDSLTRIGDRAFSGDSLLTRITIPDRVTSIGREAFKGCSLLREVTLSGSSTLTELGAYAFSGCGLLTAITLPGSLRTVGQSAFDECAGLKSLVFPEGVETIDGYVCQDCTGLRELTLPTTLTTLGYDAFKTCTNLETLTLPATVSLSSGAFARSYEKLSRVILTGSGEMAAFSSYSTPWSGIACPFSVEIREGVTSISDSVFSNRQNLTAVSLPDSVKTIGNYAFSGCSGLTELELPSGVTSIGTYAFSSCSGLTELNLPGSVTSIGNNAFSYCSGLTELEIPDSVTSVGASAFYNNTGLGSVSVPMAAVYGETGSNEAFDGCTGITRVKLRGTGDMKSMYGGNYNSGTPWRATKEPVTVELAEGITGIGEYVFWSCSSLATVVIPNTVTHIDSKAFYYSGLEALTLPSSVTSIGEDAFSSSKISRITIPDSVTSIGKYAFNACSNKPTVYYGGTKEQWEAALNGQSVTNGTAITILYETSESAYMTAQLNEIMEKESLADIKAGLEKLNTGSLSDALLEPQNRQKLAGKEGATSVRADASSPLQAESVSITGAKLNFPEQQDLTLVLAAPENPGVSVPAQGKTLRFSAKLFSGDTEVTASNLTVPMAVTIRLPGRELSEQSVRVWHSHGDTLTELRFLRVERQADGYDLTFLLDGFSDLVVAYDTGFSLTLSGGAVGVRDERNTLANCQTVYGARYQDGRMTGLWMGTRSGIRITFAEPLESGDVLFFLDGQGKPVRAKEALS